MLMNFIGLQVTLQTYFANLKDRAIDQLPEIGILAGVTVLAFFLLKLIIRNVRKIMMHRAKETENYEERETQIKQLLYTFHLAGKVLISLGAVILLFYFLGIGFGPLITKLKAWAINSLPSIILLLVITFIVLRILSFAVSKIKNVIIKRVQKEEEEPEEIKKRVETLTGIIFGAGRVIIWIIVGIILLKQIGIDIAPLLAGAGIAGLAIGFGAQELVRDFISGFFMLMENQIRQGDVAIINGTGGIVERIELRTTTLRDFSQVAHVFQNGKINTISNMTKYWSAMVFDIGVAYKEDPDHVMDVMRQVGEEMQNDSEYGPLIIEPLEIFGVDQFGDSAVVIKARIKTKPIQQWTVGREFKRRLKKAFDAHGIEIPFPHQTIYWGAKIDPLQVQVDGKNSEVKDAKQNT